MNIILILSLLCPISCHRFKKLGGHILDDVMIDLVYCPMSKRLKKRERISKWKQKRGEMEEVLAEKRQVYTSAETGECKQEDLKVIPVKIPREGEEGQ